MSNNPHIGSSFEDFLKWEGRLGEATTTAITRGMARQYDEEIELVRGTDNPFRDAGFPDPETKLEQATLAADIIRTLRERTLTNAQAGKLAGVPARDIARIRNADLSRFTIETLTAILTALQRL